MEKFDKERMPRKSNYYPPEVREKIMQFVHYFQTENDSGIIGFERLQVIIRKNKADFDGYHPGKTSLQKWYREWKKANKIVDI